MKTFELIVFGACIAIVFGERARFDNYRIYSVHVENGQQLNVLRELEIHPDGILFQALPTKVGQIVDLITPPHKIADISELFEIFKFKNQIKTKNLQKYEMYDFDLSGFSFAKMAFLFIDWLMLNSGRFWTMALILDGNNTTIWVQFIIGLIKC